MKKEKKPNDKAQQEFESSYFNTARNLIRDELSLLPRHFFFPTVSHRGERETRVTGDEAQGTGGELLYQVTHGVQRRRIFEQASRAKCVAACV